MVLTVQAGAHPMTSAVHKLLTRQKKRIVEVQKEALDAYLPNDMVDTARFVAKMQGKEQQSGRSNLERFDKGAKWLTTVHYKLGFMQKELLNIGRLILIPRMFGSQ